MTSILGNTRRPDIKFHYSGKIDISATIAKQLSLYKGDVIDIIIHNGEYYLVVRAKANQIFGRHEAQCFPTNTKAGHCNTLRAYSKRLCDAVLQVTDSVEAHLPAGAAEVIEPYGAAIPLITRNNLIQCKRK
jgi:hypothetical protein